MYVYVYICADYYRLVIKRHQLNLQANNNIDLWLHSHQQNKPTSKQTIKKTKKSIHSRGQWNLISSAGEPEQK